MWGSISWHTVKSYAQRSDESFGSTLLLPVVARMSDTSKHKKYQNCTKTAPELHKNYNKQPIKCGSRA
jgi:hypothetical protein